MNAYTKKNLITFLLGSLAGLTFSYVLIERRKLLEYLINGFKILKNIKIKNKKNSAVAIPEECPGIDNENAGKSKICEGCPNRKICNDPELKKEKEKEKNKAFNEIKENLKNVKCKILILSGKGGVGKSTVAAQIAFALSYLNYDVGLLDIDICGPSIPILTKTINYDVNYSMNGWIPIYKNNLSIMSVGYLLPNFDDPVIWRGPKKNGLIKQFLCDVYWKNLDFLIIDTPPGTSDEHLTICSYLKDNLDGCLIVTTPHILSICDVKKEIEFCKKTNIPILGIIENMYQSIFISNYTVEKMCSEMSVPYSGKVTFHQNLIEACQKGIGCCDIDPYSPSSREIFFLCKFFIEQILKKYTHQLNETNENPSLKDDKIHINNSENQKNIKEENNGDDKMSNKFNSISCVEENLTKIQMLNKLINEINLYIEEKNE
ncbi:cytosolic Fe-S cluster assembly factor NBP35, putative [Plasmodium gallinaceum]|uniref:Cytosolic Fe-S cluster assembly factor NBP35, putative n=1 Tax=Plasmodium gallinaceum TaxID=5849 RepID=A0A1J1GVS9_PLAGA|nr:cytosolic Fe-S cluster assembly factor NBP35, putative [Plasmodium gallinaceum]CRG96656.1 cytosolic Fe-S cluster assembly factor NBP35, putative [Plasmodium gallinaceum]